MSSIPVIGIFDNYTRTVRNGGTGTFVCLYLDFY